MAVAGALLLGSRECRPRTRYSPIVQTENSPGPSADILGSANVGELESKLPRLSSKLRDMAKTRGTRGLSDLYEKTSPHLLALMSDERQERNLSYVDDLSFLSEFFGKAGSLDEKMAIIFLALPRLEEGTVVFGNPPEPGSIIFERLHAERSFLEMVGDDPEVAFLEDVLLGTFCKPGGPAPDERDRALFFEEFAKLY